MWDHHKHSPILLEIDDVTSTVRELIRHAMDSGERGEQKIEILK